MTKTKKRAGHNEDKKNGSEERKVSIGRRKGK